jgi:hypothetical protein
VPRHAGLLALGSLLALAAAALVACAGNPVAALAIGAAPEKVAKTDDHNPGTAAALAAFREALTAGAYDRLPALRTQLTAAYLENPRHPVVALYLGMAHLWTMSESTRMNPSPPTVTDHAVLANKYLSEAARLAPADLRIAGFVASTELALGAIHQDEKLTRKGYFAMLDAARAKPDFNGFTASYVLSRAVHDDPSSLPGLIEQMWRAQEDCLGRSLDRQRHDLREELRAGLAAVPPDKRGTCWNTTLVPHNVEGFYMHFGDLYVAQGALDAAAAMYRNASAVPSYASWPYRAQLETRIAERAANSKRFIAPLAPGQQGLMTTTSYSCAGCHEKGKG